MCINRESLMWVVAGKFIHFQVIIMRTLSSIWTCSSPPLLSHQLVINICEGTLWHFNSISMFYSPNPPTIHWRRRSSRVDLHRCWREIAEKRTALNIIKVIGITFSLSLKLSPYPSSVFFYGSSSPPRRKDSECANGVTLCAVRVVSVNGSRYVWQAISFSHMSTWGLHEWGRHIELNICFLERVLVTTLRSTSRLLGLLQLPLALPLD